MSVKEPLQWGEKSENPYSGSSNKQDHKEPEKSHSKKDIFHRSNTTEEADGWWMLDPVSDSNQALNLPSPSDEQGIGDILYELFPDPEADPVEEVSDLRHRR